MDGEAYRKQLFFEHGKKVIYAIVLGSIYGMIVAALLLYNTFCVDLEKIRFGFNP